MFLLRRQLIILPLPRLFTRYLHHSLSSPATPPTTERTPDVTTFLTQIGRNAVKHAPKFPSWDSFFATTSRQMRALGVEPPRDRRYILHWREKFRALGGKLVLKEHRRGVKVDGGERRRAAVRAKRRQEEGKARRKARDAGRETERAKYL